MDGLYSVTVKNSSGCSSQPVSYNYQKQNLVNSYTLLGLSSINLYQNNYVQKGSVGVTANNGTLTIGKNSSINGPGSFLKAKYITWTVPITYLSAISAPVTGVVLPTMQYNTSSTYRLSNLHVPNNTTVTYNGNFNTVTIGKNCTVTLNGSIFGNINIGAGSKVKFGNNSVNVQNINVNDGFATTATNLSFASNTSVKVKEGIIIGRSTVINPDGYNVVFYLGGSSTFEEFEVHGDNTTINASVYAPNSSIEVEGDYNSTIHMKGFYIGKYIRSTSKNVYWNPYDCSNTSSNIQSAALITKTEPIKGVLDHTNDEKIEVSVSPNPMQTTSTITYTLPEDRHIRLAIYNSLGLQVAVLSDGVMSAGKHQLSFNGTKLASGLYMYSLQTLDKTGKPVNITGKIVIAK